MYYASFGVLAIILHLIINHEFIWKWKGELNLLPLIKRYRAFLFSVMLYYITDVLWGFLYDTRIIPLAYTDTVLYFLSMVLSVLLWTRAVVVYLDTKGKFGSFLTYAGWSIFSIEIVCLIVNFFYPIIFSMTEADGYVPGIARYITLVLQVVLFMMSSIYTIISAAKSEGKMRIRNKTVGGSGVVMSVFIVLQALYPFLPLYAIGLLIGTCVIHAFVEENMKRELDIELGEAQKKVEIEQQETMRVKKRTINFTRIAESLASNYDIIYYVDTVDNSYVSYSSDHRAGRLELKMKGDDFFAEARENIKTVIIPEDRERIRTFLDREYLLDVLKKHKQFNSDYQMINDGKPQYTRLIARKSSSGEHFIIAVENVDEEIIREKEQQEALKAEMSLARHDELTGIKNKTAYAELEQSVQNNLDRGVDYLPFGIIVCDINDLKKVNDTEGHQAGDELICAASKMICDIFAHCPVFRIGGDEFVVFIQGDDYNAREELVMRLRTNVFQNLVHKSGPVVAFGMAEFEPGVDHRVTDIFERADAQMYANKRELKEQSM